MRRADIKAGAVYAMRSGSHMMVEFVGEVFHDLDTCKRWPQLGVKWVRCGRRHPSHPWTPDTGRNRMTTGRLRGQCSLATFASNAVEAVRGGAS